jgi:hypothetical protein
MRWAWHIADMGEVVYSYKILFGKSYWKWFCGDFHVDRTIILREIPNTVWAEFNCLGVGSIGGFLWTRQWLLGFASGATVSQGRLWFMEFFRHLSNLRLLTITVFVIITRSQVKVNYRHMWFEAFTATVYNEVFSGDQSGQYGIGIWLRDCFRRQGLMWWLLCSHVIFIHALSSIPAWTAWGTVDRRCDVLSQSRPVNWIHVACRWPFLTMFLSSPVCFITVMNLRVP